MAPVVLIRVFPAWREHGMCFGRRPATPPGAHADSQAAREAAAARRFHPARSSQQRC